MTRENEKLDFSSTGLSRLACDERSVSIPMLMEPGFIPRYMLVFGTSKVLGNAVRAICRTWVLLTGPQVIGR